MAGISNGGGPQITLLGSKGGGDQQLHAPGTSSQVGTHANGRYYERVTIDVGPMLMILIELREREREHGITSDTPNDQLGQNALDHREIRRLEGCDGRDHEDQGMVAKQPSGVVLGRTFDDDQLGEGACYGQYGRSGGECRCPGNPLFIHVYQFQGEPVETQYLGQPPFLLVFQRRPWMGLVPSKLSWGPSPLFIPITKYAHSPPLGTLL